MTKKVLMIGGTGFLGYYAIRELLKLNYEVTILALPPLPAEGLFPPEVKITLADMNKLTDDEVGALLKGQDAVVYAAGADDRVVPKAPAYPFFYKHNVEATRRLIGIAKNAGVKKGVVLGSYFAYFAREWPQLELTKHHPYIRSRVEQEEAAITAGGSEMEVMILELPYIFGSMPGRTPIWKPLINYIRSTGILFYTRGGTNCITVEDVGAAIAGAVERGRGGQRYAIGGQNLTWVELLGKLSHFTGKEKKVVTLPNGLVTIGTVFVKLIHWLEGKQSGLDPIQLVKLQTANTFFDASIAQKELGFGTGNLDEALQKTIKACD
ncbi:MAG: NAD(P)H-binding protein [Anaerolineaceae bacterium]|nr:NAD(P)H-binding protein [Anaerolineaceae bacterium]